jgi:ArsR family transcriptional regulator
VFIEDCQYVKGVAVPQFTTGRACSVLAAPLTAGEASVLASGFAALADPGRLRLLSLIADRPEVCACALVEPLGKSQPTVSHHLKVLTEAGLITGDKRGRWIWYRVVPGQLDLLRRALEQPAGVPA